MNGWVATPRDSTQPGPRKWPFTGPRAGGPSTREPGTLGPWRAPLGPGRRPPASPLLRGVVFSLLTL